MSLNLKKIILPGTWRYIGLRMSGYDATNIPIAAKSGKALEDFFEGHCFQLGRRRVTNIVVVVKDPLHLVYVRPEYTKYREAALEVFRSCPWPVEIDHSLTISWNIISIATGRLDR